MTDDQPPPPSRRSSKDRAKEVARLLRTIQEQAEETEFVRLAPGPPPRSPVWYLVLVLGLVLNAWVWFDRPSWLVGAPPAAEAPADRERALRFHMCLQAQAIEAHRIATGDLPDSLDELRGALPGMRYQRSGARSWELLGEVGELRLLLRGSQPIEEFLGDYEPLFGLAAPPEPALP